MPRSFFLVRLPAAANFATAACGGGLGGLSAGVGVHLGIEHEHVDVLILRQHMIQSAVADVVGPAVAAEDPEGLLGQQVAYRADDLALRQDRSSDSPRLSLSEQLRAGFLEPSAQSMFSSQAFAAAFTSSLSAVSASLRTLSASFSRRCGTPRLHAEAELGVILEQAVRPGGAVAFFVGGVGAGRSASRHRWRSSPWHWR